MATGCQCTRRIEHSTSGHCRSQAEPSFDLVHPVSFQTNSAVTVHSHFIRTSLCKPFRTTSRASTTVGQYPSLIDQSSLRVKLYQVVLKRITLRHLRHLRHTRSRHWWHSGTQRANQQTIPKEQIRHQSRLCSSHSLRDAGSILIRRLDSHSGNILWWFILGSVLRDSS